MKEEIRSDLYGSYCRFMKEAGLLSSDLRSEPSLFAPDRGMTLAALADIEDDSRFMQKKLHDMGALKDISIIEFNSQWLCEENEHGTALRALARLRGVEAVPIDHGYIARDPRAILQMLTYRVARMHHEGITAAYLAHGAIQEFIALSAYLILAETAPTENERSILKGIARQEGRHMRFYRTGAAAILERSSDRVRQAVRWTFEKYWRPPGMELLGGDRWLRTFAPVLVGEEARERFAGADRMMHSLPGLEGIRLMTRFLDEHPSESMLELSERQAS